MNIARAMKCAVFLVFLSACKADEVEITFDASKAIGVAEGTTAVATFEATFSGIGEIDNEQRREIDRFRDALEKYVSFEEFEVSAKDFGFEVSIEGEILIANEASQPDAYFLHVQPSDIFPGYYRVQLKNGTNFSAMQATMRNINLMMSPNEFHPIEFRIRGENYQIIAVGTMVSARPYLIYKNDNVKKTIKLNMKEGIYDKVGAAVFLKPAT